MPPTPNTLFLRLEGPLQAWGVSKLIVRRTAEAPTKSGVLGMICCAMGKSRSEAPPVLAELNRLVMGVRVDRPGELWADYHTVGAGFGLLTAQGELKSDAKGTLVTRRYYLCDASFLIALQGDESTLVGVAGALSRPVWPIYLGRKCCPPSVPPLNKEDGLAAEHHPDMRSALGSRRWRPRTAADVPASEGRKPLPCLMEWRPSVEERVAPPDAEVWDDAAEFFGAFPTKQRVVVRGKVVVDVWPTPQMHPLPPPSRPRAAYGNEKYKAVRDARLLTDGHRCVFCQEPVEGRGATVQHVTYRRAGGEERLEDLRTLCRLCHDAVTMIEYGLEMGLDRIDPELPEWRERIIAKREEIIRFRSLATRRRHLQAEEV